MVLVPGAAAGNLTARDQAVIEAYQIFLRGMKEHEAPAEEETGPFASAPAAPPAAPPSARPTRYRSW